MASRKAPPDQEAEEEPLPPPAGGGGGDGWVTFAGHAFLAITTTLELRRYSRGAAFVALSYPHLLLLLYFYCLTRFQGHPRGSPGRSRLKAPLCAIGSLLAVEFAYQLTGTARLTATRVREIAAADVVGAIYSLILKRKA
uniref:Uncharacterized protein n=1 Tax=Leersia perrieri TaxID=77586 RepID=A0A0D9VDT0_9ORYZ